MITGIKSPCRACEKQPYRSGIAHGSRSAFRIIVVEQACASPRLRRLVSLPPALVIPSTFAGSVLCALLPFRFPAPCVRHRRHRQRERVVSRQDYWVNIAPNSPLDLSCIIAKLFRSRFQSASYTSSSDPSDPFSRAPRSKKGITLPSRRQSDNVLFGV